MDYDLMAMSDVCTYVWWAEYHDIPLKFDVTDEQTVWCQVASDQFTYEWFTASEDYHKLGMNQMLNFVMETFKVVFEGADVTQQPVISKNVFSENSIYTDSLPYLMVLLGHNETLQPLLRSLGIDRLKKVNVSSAVFFEFSEDADGAQYVGVNMRDDTGFVSDLKLPCAEKDLDGRKVCTAEAFKGFLTKKLEESAAVYDKTDYVAPTKFADTKTYAKGLYE